MTDDLKTLLAELVDDQPQPGIDLDRQITRGRRRARRRNVAAVAGSVAVVAGAVVGGYALVPRIPDGTDSSPAGAPSPSPTLTYLTRDALPDPTSRRRATERSGELAAELERLTPEIAATPGAKRFDEESFRPDGLPDRMMRAGAVWTYPAGERQDSVAVSVEVAAGNGRVATVCTGMDAPINSRCSEVRRLPDGSTAYIHNYEVDGAPQYEVRIERPDGSQVMVGTGAHSVVGSQHQTPLTPARVLEIAQGITITP